MRWVVMMMPLVLAGGVFGQGVASGPAVREVQTPIEPAPITVGFTGVSLSQAAQELTRAMGVPVKEWRGGRANETFTLAAKGEAFWDIFGAMSAQHPIVPRDSGGFSMAAQGWGVQSFARSGGFVLYVGGLSRSRNVNLQAEAGKQVEPEKLTMDVTVAAEPRIVVLQRGVPQFSEIVDDAGHALLKKQEADVLANTDPARAGIWDATVGLDVPAGLGKKIVSAKATERLVVQTAERRTELEKIGERLNEKIAVGDRTLVVTGFKATTSNVQMTATLSAVMKEDPPRPTGLIRLLITDAGEQQVWHGPLTSAKVSISASGTFVLPLKVVLVVSSKWEEVRVPFELRDVALPR